MQLLILPQIFIILNAQQKIKIYMIVWKLLPEIYEIKTLLN